MITVYCSPVPAPAEAGELMALLPPWRQEKARRRTNEKAFCACLGAGLLWRFAMERAGLDPLQPVQTLPAGKPVLASGEAHFSLSHSGPWALCALGDRPLGADVQELRPARLSVARRFCPEEKAWLDALPPAEQPEALLMLWARKEAWVKAESRDRMLALDEFSVLSPPGPWHFSDWRLPDGARAALCAEGPAPAPVLLDIQTILNTLKQKGEPT